MNLIIQGMIFLFGVFSGVFLIIFFTIIPAKDFSNEVIVSSCGVMIALCAFLLTIKQTFSIEGHQRISVLPNLGILNQFHQHSQTMNMTIHNYGVGPAILKEFVLKVDGKAVPLDGYNDLVTSLKPFIKENINTRLAFQTFENGTYIPSNSERDIFKIIVTTKDFDVTKLYEEIKDRITVHVVYEDLYHNKYRLDDRFH